MPAFEPQTQPTNVGVGGAVATIVVPARYRALRVARIQVVHKSGAAASYDTTVSTDSLVAEKKKQVAKFTGDTPAAPCDYDNNGAGYAWHFPDSPAADGASSLYVKIMPNAGADNNFDVRAYFDEPGA